MGNRNEINLIDCIYIPPCMCRVYIEVISAGNC